MYVSPPFNQLVGNTLGNYRLEQLLGQGASGPLYAARSQQAPGTTFLVRVLAVPPDLTPTARSNFLTRFQRQLEHLSTLQHPYILPLVDYGVHSGILYLVSPGVALRSLSARLTQSGPLDVVTIGRYLDQIAGALEYAHEHSTLHRNLSTDDIYIQLDGRLVVAGFGVRRLIELSHGDGPSNLAYGTGETDAPEQILGQRVDTFTDTYALGAVLFRMLTGTPVFAAERRDDVVQQHLYAPVPPIGMRRSGLPLALDGIIATAMAKDPANRYNRPGAVANAYHQVIAPNNAARVPFIAATLPVQGSKPPTGVADWSNTSRHAAPSGATSGPALAGSGGLSLPPRSSPIGGSSARVPRLRRANTVRVAIFALVILALIGGTTLALLNIANGPMIGAHASGQVTFLDGQSIRPGGSDALKIIIHDLDAPPHGYQYDAWLINDQSEQVLALGTLAPKNGAYVLTDPGNGQNGQPGTNLLGSGNKIEITLEQGNVKLPVGRTVLSGAFPPVAFSHIRHLLVSFPATPGQTGLIVGMLNQTKLVEEEAQILQQATATHDSAIAECAAQSLVNLIEGQHSAHYQPVPIPCIAQTPSAIGDGFGLLGDGGYLAKAAEHTSNAAIAPDATAAMHQHAANIEVALTNTKGWLTALDNDAVALVQNPADTAVVPEIVSLASHASNGVDTNGDQQIDPVAGEAGVATALSQAQAMASLTLYPAR